VLADGEEFATGFLSELTFDRYIQELIDDATEIANLAQPVKGHTAHEALTAAALFGPARARLVQVAAAVPARLTSVIRPLTDALPVMLAGLLLMTAAVLTVLAAQYLPNPAFGTIGNYITLIATTFGSAQVVAILTALLLLRPSAEWYP
jgi:hypothetical protein